MANLFNNFILILVIIASLSYDIAIAEDHEASGDSGDEAVEAYEAPLEPDMSAVVGLKEPLALLKRLFQIEHAAHPYLYDSLDVDEFLNDNGKFGALQFLQQRDFDVKGAYYLACETLHWRAKMAINRLDASHFPCDLFKLGLIFEEGVAYRRTGEGTFETGNPVIWIRLGALGAVIKHLENPQAARVASFSYNAARKGASKVKHGVRKARRSRKRSRQARRARKALKGQRAPLIKDLSVKNDGTMKTVLSAVSWWLNEWRHRHPTGAQATLVLDFENTDFALSSWSMGEFFIGLDDHFPNLFDQVIGFRFKPKLWSFRSPISMFNRIFKSRISSSLATDRKLKFVRNEPQIGAFMARIDAEGFSLLPKHVTGDCLGPIHEPPAGCQADPNILAVPGGLDPQLWNAIHQEFYVVCKPRQKKQ